MEGSKLNKPKKYQQQGPNLLLPIADAQFYELQVGLHGPTLVFRDADGDEAQIKVEHDFVLTRFAVEYTIGWLTPASFAPLLELLGSAVAEAIAFANGELLIHFADDSEIRVSPSEWFEAWHFTYSRHHLHLHGGGGRLI